MGAVSPKSELSHFDQTVCKRCFLKLRLSFTHSTTEDNVWPFKTGREVVLHSEDPGQNVLIVHRSVAEIYVRYWTYSHTFIRGVQMRVSYVHAHVEVPGHVPLGARTDLPEREVRATAIALTVVDGYRRPYRAFNRLPARNAGSRRWRRQVLGSMRVHDF